MCRLILLSKINLADRRRLWYITTRRTVNVVQKNHTTAGQTHSKQQVQALYRYLIFLQALEWDILLLGAPATAAHLTNTFRALVIELVTRDYSPH